VLLAFVVLLIVVRGLRRQWRRSVAAAVAVAVAASQHQLATASQPAPVPSRDHDDDEDDHDDDQASWVPKTDSSQAYGSRGHVLGAEYVLVEVVWCNVAGGGLLNTYANIVSVDMTVALLLPLVQQFFQQNGALEFDGAYAHLEATMGQLADEGTVVRFVYEDGQQEWQQMMHDQELSAQMRQAADLFTPRLWVHQEELFGHSFEVVLTRPLDDSIRKEARDLYSNMYRYQIRNAVLALEGMDLALFAYFGELLLSKSQGKITWLKQYVDSAFALGREGNVALTRLPDGSTLLMADVHMMDRAVAHSQWW